MRVEVWIGPGPGGFRCDHDDECDPEAESCAESGAGDPDVPEA
jgi:hypothetical protein